MPRRKCPTRCFCNVMAVLDAVAVETGKTVPQIALNWGLSRPTASTVILGARNAAQLRDNLGALGWDLTPDQMMRLEDASRLPKPCPYWHQHGFHRNPAPV